jgi:cob(I)alamin adenosyltransferase
MPKITKVYTRGGDEGTTSLGTGERVAKDAPRLEAYGTVDELNSVLGWAIAIGLAPDVAEALRGVQNELFHLGADLCVPEEDKLRLPVPQIGAPHVEALEALMDRLSESLAPLDNFILPGGSPGAGALHLARTVCRRAERLVVALARNEKVGTHAIPYLNRLSDALFVMARYENRQRGVPDVLWDSRR